MDESYLYSVERANKKHLKNTKMSKAKLSIEDGVKSGEKAKAKTGPRKPIETAIEELFGEGLEEEGDEEAGTSGVCYQIIKLHTKGYSRSDIVKAGYNRSTVYRQVGEFTKLRNAPATSYLGFELYEARIQRVMRTKKLSREAAILYITDKDTE